LIPYPSPESAQGQRNRAMKRLQRSLFVFFLWAIVTVAALITADPVFSSLSYLLGGVLVLSFLWAWSNLHGLKVIRRTRATRSQVGEMAEERFIVENTGYLPKLWLELKDHSTLPGHRASHVISDLRGKHRHTRIVRTMCLRRGRFRLGPITLHSGDPFGLFTLSRSLPLSTHLVVYPRTVPLPYFQPLLGEITGGDAAYRRTHYVTTNVAGVREYAPGDSFNRIHWPSTARTNRLIVKEFELDPMADVWLILDMERTVHVGPAYEDLPELAVPEVPWEGWRLPDMDPSTEEYCITITASLVQYFLRQDRAVGMITYPDGSHCEMAQSDRGARQEDRLLEMLAVTHPHGSISLEQVLLAEGTRFNRNTTLLIITPSVKTDWVAVAHHLASRGVKVTAIVVDPGSFGYPYTADPTLAELAASHIPAYVVRQGDRLSAAIANLRR